MRCSAAARETRTVVGRDLERLGNATETSWNELRDDLQASLDSLDRQIRTLQPDAKPMGGAGPELTGITHFSLIARPLR